MTGFHAAARSTCSRLLDLFILEPGLAVLVVVGSRVLHLLATALALEFAFNEEAATRGLPILREGAVSIGCLASGSSDISSVKEIFVDGTKGISGHGKRLNSGRRLAKTFLEDGVNQRFCRSMQLANALGLHENFAAVSFVGLETVGLVEELHEGLQAFNLELVFALGGHVDQGAEVLGETASVVQKLGDETRNVEMSLLQLALKLAHGDVPDVQDGVAEIMLGIQRPLLKRINRNAEGHFGKRRFERVKPDG